MEIKIDLEEKDLMELRLELEKLIDDNIDVCTAWDLVDYILHQMKEAVE